MELYRTNNFEGEKLREKNLSFVNIFEEIPIKVSNSALISAFMTELEADTPVTQCGYDRPQLSTSPIQWNNKRSVSFQFYYRNLSRQEAQKQAWLQKRRVREPLPEEDPTNPIFKPTPEPSRLDSFLVTNQIANYCNQINGYSVVNLLQVCFLLAALIALVLDIVAGQSFSRLYLMKALHEK
ncbi:hypothetical protein SASPL_116370 [Salvia splendens]|uniref:eIF3h C-terminal domain-containing protein n=1 Tax=Salvia splendens TaxID=180675 RepID=A0A8X8XTN6_SALSN|nr:hypothetical protein SASPL_116370 [Salvia splendens]